MSGCSMRCALPAISLHRRPAHCSIPTAPVSTRDDFREALGVLGMVARMSRNGNCSDNAVSESLFATLRAEEAAPPYATKQEARRAIAQYIHGFYNPVRLHSSRGDLSPNEYARRMQHVDQTPSKRSVA